MNVFLKLRYPDQQEGQTGAKEVIEELEKEEIKNKIESYGAEDIKEYQVKGSDGDKIRFVFTLQTKEKALECYHDLALIKTPFSNKKLTPKIYYLLPGKLLY